MRLNNKAVMATDMATKTSRVWFVVDLKPASSYFKTFFLYFIMDEWFICKSTGRCHNSDTKQKISYHKFPADGKLKRKWLVNIKRDENKYFQVL